MTLDELLAGPVAVWGLGQEGRAVLDLLTRRGATPTVVDDRPGAVAPDGTPALAPGAVDWRTVRAVVRSPGVSRYRPELVAARAAGAVVTTATAVWLEDVAGGPVVAVTGTKGKSTTAALCAAVLAADGTDVALLGNIGVPVVEAYDRPAAGAYVVEVSSYQAAEVTRTPGVCVLTSLAPDHLDWHGGVDRYYADKLRLVEAGPPGALAVGAASDEAVARTAAHPHRWLYGPEGPVRVTASGWVTCEGVPLVEVDRLRVPGAHNLWNLCGAVAGARLLLGRPPSAAAVAAAVDGFEGLPSRCRTIGTVDGRTLVDDALASNPFATCASLEAFPGRDLTVLLGGADRGVDRAPLVAALAARRPAPAVVVLPPDGGPLADELTAAGCARVEVADDLADGVARALAATPAGGVVLFSPGAPTPPGGGGYGERSRRFADAAGLGPA